MKKLSLLMAVILIALSFTACVNYRADDLVDTGSLTDWTLSWSSFKGEISHTFNYEVTDKSYLAFSAYYSDYLEVYIENNGNRVDVPTTVEKFSLNWIVGNDFILTVKADTKSEAGFYFKICE